MTKHDADSIGKGDSSPKLYLDRGLEEAKSDLNLAVADFSKAIELNPLYAEAYVNRGLVYAKLGKHSLALHDYDRALTIDANLPEAHFNRGLSHSATGDFATAAIDHLRAIALDPKYVKALNSLAQVLINLDRNDEAVSFLDKTIELDPQRATAYYLRGRAYANLTVKDKATQDFERAIRLGLAPSLLQQAQSQLALLKSSA